MSDNGNSLFNTYIYLVPESWVMPETKNGPKSLAIHERGVKVWVLTSWCELDTEGLPNPFKYKKGFCTVLSWAVNNLEQCLCQADCAGDYL